MSATMAATSGAALSAIRDRFERPPSLLVGIAEAFVEETFGPPEFGSLHLVTVFEFGSQVGAEFQSSGSFSVGPLG